MQIPTIVIFEWPNSAHQVWCQIAVDLVLLICLDILVQTCLVLFDPDCKGYLYIRFALLYTYLINMIFFIYFVGLVSKPNFDVNPTKRATTIHWGEVGDFK